jgi:hypothetical protein
MRFRHHLCRDDMLTQRFCGSWARLPRRLALGHALNPSKLTVLLVIKTQLESVATQERTILLGNIRTLEEDIEHLVLMQQRGGPFKTGMSRIYGDTLIRKLAQSKENNQGPQCSLTC